MAGREIVRFSRCTVFYGVICIVDVNYIAKARAKVIVKNRTQI
jgi:DNA replication initiation complex subunit (GINS family)